MRCLRHLTRSGLVYLFVTGTIALTAPVYGQTGTTVAAVMGDRCSGVMEHLDSTRGDRSRFIKALVAADAGCLGLVERADKARMITRAEYIKLFKREPDCSSAAYSYMCAKHNEVE